MLGDSIDLHRAIMIAIILLISIDIHELAHAVVADRLGDPTPRRMGEISLNPFTHMDQVGIILLIITSLGFLGFTYGRTHVTPTNLKFGPQRGNAIVAVVGPLSNLALAIVFAVAYTLYIRGTYDLNADGQLFVLLGLYINVLLFLLNLLPIPPLDGFTVLGGFLTARQMYALAPLAQWGPLILLLLFFSDPYTHWLSDGLVPAIDQVVRIICPDCF